MYSKCWQIIRNDSKKTFEICGQDDNTNHFTNLVHGMQKAGMSVTGMTPPVTGKNSSKETIKISGYTRVEGLYDRLLKEYRKITQEGFDHWEE
jgi:hypothetical protein